MVAKKWAHVIDSVDFKSCGKDYDSAPLACICGWSGRAGDFAAHRSAQGLSPKGTYWQKRAEEPGAYQPQFMQSLPPRETA